MHVSSVEPDTHTYPFLLKAVAKLTAVREGEKIHSISIRSGFESLVFVLKSLVHMYAACGHADCAHKMFDLRENVLSGCGVKHWFYASQ